MKRRNFFKIIAGGVAVAVLPKTAVTEAIAEHPHGFVDMGDGKLQEITDVKAVTETDWTPTYNDSMTVHFSVDGVDQCATFDSQPTTVEQVSNAINEQLDGITTTFEDGRVVVRSSNRGSDVSIEYK